MTPATNSTDSNSSSDTPVGIIGIWPLELSEIVQTNIVEVLYNLGEIRKASFSFYLSKNPETTPSQFVFGGLDPKYYTGVIRY